MNEEIFNAWSKLLVTMANNRRDELTDIDELLNAIGKPILEAKKTEQPTQQEIESLKNVEKVSSKGPYQLISKEDNTGNSAFEKLQNYIKEHNGFVVLHGLKCWNFDKSDKIGIKK